VGGRGLELDEFALTRIRLCVFREGVGEIMGGVDLLAFTFAKMELEEVVLKSSKNIHEDQFDLMVYCYPGMAAKWRKNPDQTPLVDVVQRFEVFRTNVKSSQGLAMRASHDELDRVFGTHNAEDVVRRILAEGRIKELKHGFIFDRYREGSGNLTKQGN
jgi:hypothetical protein